MSHIRIWSLDHLVKPLKRRHPHAAVEPPAAEDAQQPTPAIDDRETAHSAGMRVEIPPLPGREILR